jgi:hypothetical protein
MITLMKYTRVLLTEKALMARHTANLLIQAGQPTKPFVTGEEHIYLEETYINPSHIFQISPADHTLESEENKPLPHSRSVLFCINGALVFSIEEPGELCDKWNNCFGGLK